MSPPSPSSCCSNGVCNKPTTPTVISKPQSNCCSNGVCKKSAETPPSRPSIPKSGCCSSGACTLPQRDSSISHADNMKADFKHALGSLNADEVKETGNSFYKNGMFQEALQLYERAIFLEPRKAPFRANKAAALAGLGRLPEAILECQEAISIDLNYTRAHQRLAGLLIRLGKLREAKTSIHVAPSGEMKEELLKLNAVESHVEKCKDAFKMKSWANLLQESEAAIVAGADQWPQLVMWKSEALLNLRRPEEASRALELAKKLHSFVEGEDIDTHFCVLGATIDIALGRFESAIASAEKGSKKLPNSSELLEIAEKAKMLSNSRSQGNELFKLGDMEGAVAAYREGLKVDPTNAVLLCNQAACLSKMDQWEAALTCSEKALASHPTYTKALLRKATCHMKLSMWSEAIADYEAVLRDVPNDPEVSKLLTEAKLQLQKKNGGTFLSKAALNGGEVIEIARAEEFKAVLECFDLVIVDFFATWCGPCKQIAPLFTKLSNQYNKARFIKVDIDRHRFISTSEGIKSVPTFKVFKQGRKVHEIAGANGQELESVIRRYSNP